MRFHGITMKGEYKAQTVVDASALVYSASDERRIVYDQTTKQLWFANSSEWIGYGYGDVPTGAEMWIYADSAPSGWTINGTPSDDLLAVKGGGTYVTGGTGAGSFTTPNHSHVMGSHTHTVGGVAAANPPNAGQEHGDGGSFISSQVHQHVFVIVSTQASPASTSVDGGTTGYRPLSRVGVVCTKD